MAHESFEDEETAEILNSNYVSIKVDREERPDIDAVYMKVCQALTGQGGWPLNVFLTPDQKPFYAGTYFPKDSVYGRPAFKDVLLELKSRYDQTPDKIAKIGTQIVQALSEQTKSRSKLTEKVLDQAFNAFSESLDPEFGGFGQAPKFPAPHQLMFLLRYARWNKNDQALDMVKKTLDGLAAGGIHDQIGGGFARYSTDEKWLIPHFEKMLYDQAMLAIIYTEAGQVTGDSAYEEVVEDIFSYCERELLSSNGGFYCSQDADSEGVEGKCYTWRPEEILSVLGEDEGRLFCMAYHITSEGNFEGKNVPNLIGTNLEKLAEKWRVSTQGILERLKRSREKLLIVRNRRIQPAKDDKILTSWNALIIIALAKAGKSLHKENYVNLSMAAFHFIKEYLTQNGKLMARFRDDETRYQGYLDDYAFLMLACEALYEATLDIQYLTEMRGLGDEMVRQFWDPENGGFFLQNNETARLIFPTKEAYDSAIPSGNSAAAYAMLRLSEWTGENQYAAYADRIFSAFSDEVLSYPSGYTFMLSAFHYQISGPRELIALQGEKGEKVEKSIRELNCLFLPEFTVFAGDRTALANINKNVGIYSPIGGRSTYFLCEQFVCHLPVTEIKKLKKQLFNMES
ncbi:thioredoxin domain-containing protein [Sporolactobacillus pectinivorans]|uniref:thioredoxin domain-containing protein n=1 Tax=Sporolactobacillus pectinivorans TaxID=1591408 RepID=UPI000C2694AA|nr:thioredoxin domain-containing protein [Sporolactobacillus pectinivorans]